MTCTQAQFVAQETIGDRLKAEQVKLENDHESVSKGGAILFLSPDARFRRAMRCLTKYGSRIDFPFRLQALISFCLTCFFLKTMETPVYWV